VQSRRNHQLAFAAEVFVTAPETFDLVVIGCGPAGEKGGAQAAYFGKRVAVIERAAVVAEAASIPERCPARLFENPPFIFPA
jgi:hypothetical protein